MDIPLDYDPYGMLMELFLREATELNADEILVVSREGRSNVYFVSGNRVRKLVKLCSDISSGLAVRLAQEWEPSEQLSKNIPIRVVDNLFIAGNVTVPPAKPSDVNCTMPMPPLWS